MNPTRVLPLLAIVFLCTFSGTCDHTVLRGEVRVPKNTLLVGEEVSLELVLPPEFESVQHVTWEVEPSDGAMLRAHRYPFRYNEPLPGKDDRTARFSASRPGKYTVSVFGYFRQTNTQPITEIRLQVIDR